MYEAELKFRIDKENLPELEEKLLSFHPSSVLKFIYVDTYYDDPDNSLYQTEKELRIRRKYAAHSSKAEFLLTFKDIPFDFRSGSKPEYEISVDDADTLEKILDLLGFKKKGAFSKHCILYTLTHKSYEVKAALVSLDKIEDLFLELEITVESLDHTTVALSLLHDFSELLGLSEVNFTKEYYTDMLLGLNK